MTQAFQIASQHSKKSAQYNQKYYDRKVHGVDIVVGDRVLLRNHREKGGTGKLKTYWEDVVYVVIDKDADIPVYTIKPEEGTRPIKRVHRNNIMKCNLILSKVPTDKTSVPVERKVVSKQTVKREKRDLSKTAYPSIDSDSDEGMVVVQHRHAPDRHVTFSDDVFVPVDPLGEDTVQVEDTVTNVIDDSDVNDEEDVREEADAEDAAVTGDEESSEDIEVEEEEEPVRRSTRKAVAPNIFTFDRIGGEPLLRPR